MGQWPVDGGQCGRLIREKDWSDHPLGSTETWPPELRSVVETILACSFPLILLWSSDLYQLYNDAYAEIMGPRHPNGMGQKTSECWPEVWDFNRPVYDRVFAGETVDYKDQCLSLLRDGNLQKFYFDLCFSPVRTQHGTVGGVLVTVFDVSERHHATIDITEQNKRSKRLAELAAIVESSDDAIISKNLDGIITSWNAAATRILGYEPDEIIGKSILTLIPEHLHSDEPKIIAEIRAGRRIEHFETFRKKKSGELVEASLTISPVKNARGEIIGASKILRDISAQKRMEESLIQAEKIAATGRMAATIAHEVNNPLEAVTNLLFLAKLQSTDPDVIEYLQTAETELGRVAHIAKQTLGYYREHASASRVSLADIVEAAIEIYRPRCTAARIVIESHIHSSKKLVVRRGEIMQVISNLIANSIYAMPGGGTLIIDVSDSTNPGGVTITICDTGVGIPPETMPHIFEAFFTTRSTIGTGIGLFVAKQFVEGHGGAITIESNTAPQTHGTAARIFLPIVTTYEQNPNS